MDDPVAVPTLAAADHRRLAVDLFNRAWTLLDRDDRTQADDDAMVACVHASAHHWREAGGTIATTARSHWQCSRVYATLGRAEPALHHARRCLDACETGDASLADWDVAFAHEALARAHAVAGDGGAAEHHRAAGLRLAALVTDGDDRELVLADLATLATR